MNGAEPGAELMKSSYSFRDAANLLGIHSSNLYEIWRDQNLKTITVDFTKEFRSKYLKNGMNIRSCIRKSAGCLRSRIWKRLYPFAGGSSPRRGYQRNNHQMDSDGAFSSAGAGKALRIHRNEFLKWLKEYQEATQRRKKQKSEKRN